MYMYFILYPIAIGYWYQALMNMNSIMISILEIVGRELDKVPSLKNARALARYFDQSEIKKFISWWRF